MGGDFESNQPTLAKIFTTEGCEHVNINKLEWYNPSHVRPESAPMTLALYMTKGSKATL